MTMCVWMWTLHWSMRNRPGATSANNDSLPAPLQPQLSTANSPSEGAASLVMIHPIHVGILPELILYKLYAVTHSYCEFSNAVTGSRPKDSMPQLPSPSSSSLRFPEAWPVGEGVIKMSHLGRGQSHSISPTPIENLTHC